MITTSLALAKRLKGCGYPQTTFFWVSEGRVGYSPEHKHPDIGEWYASPTAEEVLAKLPGIILTMEAPCVLEAAFYPTLSPPHVTVGYKAAGLNETGWRVWNGKMLCQEADILVNAASQLYIHLAEQGLLPLIPPPPDAPPNE